MSPVDLKLSDSLFLDPEGILEMARKLQRKGEDLSDFRSNLWTHLTGCLSVFAQIEGLTPETFLRMMQWGSLPNKKIWHIFPNWRILEEKAPSFCGVSLNLPLEELPKTKHLCKRCCNYFLYRLPQDITELQRNFSPNYFPLVRWNNWKTRWESDSETMLQLLGLEDPKEEETP